uniref:Uncharacterized protein n=1 Tax=Lepeophtheirus salmonis TaxID=72036 RepID=A0A0K2TP25_LEPSM
MLPFHLDRLLVTAVSSSTMIPIFQCLPQSGDLTRHIL